MSAMGAEDESGTVREEGTCGEEKVVEGKQPIVCGTRQFFYWMLARASNDRPSFAEGHAPCAVFNQLVRSRAQLLLLE